MTQEKQPQRDMPKAYEPGRVEEKWYQFWLEQGYFTPKIDPAKKPFVIIMPPPNVTGDLHVGHALTATIEDILTRWHRMKGEPTLWLPGVDHASIAAQVVVERLLAKEGLTRQKLGREKFLERMKDWAELCRRNIREQHERLGVSCDWSRERFTLDEGPSRAVRTAFVRLYEKGLIYRGERIINWCPRCLTALSDLEVVHKELQGHLYYVKYHLADSEDEFITVATTRPETILGDTAVAVNPDDERYKKLVGRQVILPAVKRVIPIIADSAVDPAFGTGAVKVTPAHDPVDFEIGDRHNLAIINIMNPDATMNENAGPYVGLDRYTCRRELMANLEKEGLLVKTEPHTHAVGHCERCQTVTEPVASRQWFVKTGPLAAPAIAAVTEGRIQILPERFTKVYLNWMENIRDWCISRQLWWGHQIPVWYCRDCGALTVAVDEPKACSKCGSRRIEQDPDVLDTWFSSGLWPHSTLGWPDDTEDYRYFYPTSVMETGYDILFFWVARMIMMGIEDTGEAPFHTVYLHGLVRDEKGEKMSKVKGNVLNPLVTLKQYGTDALRLALITGTSPGNDIKLAPARLEAGRNFANKLWNAARFIITNLKDGESREILRESLPVEDRWILSRLSRTIVRVTGFLDDFQLGEAQREIYEFLWGDFCDWYIELAKLRLRSPEASVSPAPVLVKMLETSLRLLHPFMPFLTEELWQNLNLATGARGDSIMVAPYPEADEAAFDPEAEGIIDTVIEIVRTIRNARAEYKLESGKWITAQVYADRPAAISPYTAAIESLGRARPVTVRQRQEGRAREENSLLTVLREAEVVIPMASLFNLAEEQERLAKEISELAADVSRLETRLKDSAFLAKAPEKVVSQEQTRLNERRERLERLQEERQRLG